MLFCTSYCICNEIFLDPSIENLIFDIENVHNIWDGNMVGHTWRMSSKGLVCLDCEEIEYFNESEIEDTKEIPVKIKDLESVNLLLKPAFSTPHSHCNPNPMT